MTASSPRARVLIALLLVILAAPGHGLAESQLTAGTYVVDSKLDAADANPGDGICRTTAGACTLRAAIQEANLDGMDSTITFAAPFNETNAIQTCNLPPITDSGTTIDGSGQWDAVYNRPGIVLTGSACTIMTIDADNTSVYGLLFGGTDSTGVHITGGTLSHIGGSGAGQRNVFLALKHGVYVAMSAGVVNTIEYNYFGTDRGEYSNPGGETGISVSAAGTVISNNLIVAKSVAGISIGFGQYTFVSDNIIGLNAFKTSALPNAVGIVVSGDRNIIGEGNVIAGNTSHGIKVYKGDNNLITGNQIGY